MRSPGVERSPRNRSVYAGLGETDRCPFEFLGDAGELAFGLALEHIVGSGLECAGRGPELPANEAEHDQILAEAILAGQAVPA